MVFISKFCKLGVHTIKSASTAPTLTSRFSNFPKADNHHLIFLRQKLFSSTADKVGDEEKKKIIRSGVLRICKKVGKETCIKGRSGVVLDEGEIGKETWGTSGVLLDTGAYGRSLACSTCHDIVMRLRLKLSSSTYDKVGDEEKKKKVGKETCIEGRSGVVLDEGEIGKETWGTSGVALDEGEIARCIEEEVALALSQGLKKENMTVA